MQSLKGSLARGIRVGSCQSAYTCVLLGLQKSFVEIPMGARMTWSNPAHSQTVAHPTFPHYTYKGEIEMGHSYCSDQPVWQIDFHNCVQTHSPNFSCFSSRSFLCLFIQDQEKSLKLDISFGYSFGLPVCFWAYKPVWLYQYELSSFQVSPLLSLSVRVSALPLSNPFFLWVQLDMYGGRSRQCNT